MIITASDIRRRIALGVALLSGIVLFTAPAAAAWTLIDDFQDYNTGDIRDNVTGGVWTALGNTSLATIEQEGINQYLAFGWTDGHRSAARELPSFAQLPAGAGSATYFHRYRSNGMDTADASFGLTGPNLNTGSTAPFGDFRVQVRISDTGNHEVDVRDGGSFVDTGARIARDEWFNFWMVVHRDPTAGDRWDLYMTPGANTPDPANDLIYSSAAFRSTESGPLQHYLAIARPYVNLGPNLDALYFSPGVNLSWAALGAVWTGAASDRWRTAGNWDRAAAFPDGWSDILTFGPSAEPSVVIDGNDHLRVHTMRFVADAPAYTIDAEGGRLLRIADGGGVNVESGVTTDQHFGITLRPRLGTTTYRNDGTGLLSFDRMVTDWDGSGNAHVVFTGSGDIRAQRLDDREAPGGSQPRTMSVEKDGSGTLTLAGSSTFSGDVRVRGGILNVQHSNALGVGSKTVHARGDSGAFTVELEGGITLAENITWQTSNQSLTSPAIRNVNGDNRILGEIRMEGGGGHTAVVVDGGTLELADVTNPWDWQGGGLRNLILGGAGDGTVAGVIRDGSLAAQTSGVVKHGAGTWTLAGSNTYTGATTVHEGTLLVDGSTAAGSSVTVNAGGTLGGEGAIGGAATVRSGGTLSPGAAGIGTLTFEDNLTLEDGAAWHWEFFDTAEYDQVVAGAGSLILPESGAIGLGIYGTEGHSVGLHDQFTIFDGAVQNFDAALFELENHSNWTEGWSISEVAPGAGLLLTAVPEPGAALLLLCALACGLLVRRR